MLAAATMDSVSYAEVSHSDSDFKDPYNVFYFLGLLAVLGLPTLPAILTLIRIANGYATF